MRRSAPVLAVAAGLAVAGVVVLSGSGGADSPARGGPVVTTQKVQQGRLLSVVSLDGILTYGGRPDGSPYPVINRASGTYTALPAAGEAVGCGRVLYRVDERPVLLVCGPVPAYRDLRRGDAGDDVRQLNRTLHQRRSGGRFTAATARALAALQHAAGAAATGTLALGDAVFLPGPVRIAKVTGELGGLARPGTPVAQATSGTLEVQVQLEPSTRDDVRAGDRARVTLPGNTQVAGKLTRVGRVVQTAGGQAGGSATVPAFVGLDDPGEAAGFDQAPVGVEITTAGVRSALNVPVVALVGAAGGGFAVEVVRPGGRRALVSVRVGLFDETQGRVGVQGALHAGDDVRVPSL